MRVPSTMLTVRRRAPAQAEHRTLATRNDTPHPPEVILSLDRLKSIAC